MAAPAPAVAGPSGVVPAVAGPSGQGPPGGAQAIAGQIAQNVVQQFQPVQLPATNIQQFPYALYNLTLFNTRSFTSFGTNYAQEYSYIASLKNPQPNTYLEAILPSLSVLFESLLEELSAHYADQDLVRVFIMHEQLTSCNIIVGPKYMRDMSHQLIIQKVARVIRSNNFIPADRYLKINIAAVRNLRGTRYKCMNNVWKDLKKKRSIIAIINQDHLCLPRAIAVGIAHYEYIKHPNNSNKRRRYHAMRVIDHKKKVYETYSMQKRTAIQYADLAGISTSREGILQDVPKYEKVLQTGISVISAASQNKRIYTGNLLYRRQITLYHVMDTRGCGAGHFAVVTRMTGLLCRSYYCDKCDTGYNNKERHYCKNYCNICDSKQCVIGKADTRFYCNSCNVTCRSAECLQRHKLKPKLCASLFFCPKCHVRLRGFGRRYRPLIEHVCGEAFCRNCECYHMEDHLCYMRACSQPRKVKRFLFYDFECMQEGESDHVPNLVVCQSICEQCADETHVTPHSRCIRCGHRCSQCDSRKNDAFVSLPCPITCGYREMVFRGQDTAHHFCEWLFHPQHANCIVVAHNAKAYDAYFLYSYLVNSGMNPHIIFTGTKIMYCHVRKNLNIKILDSVNFLPMPLAALPASFGLEESQKGFYPHFLNTFHPSQIEYPHLPDPQYYGVDEMSLKRREEFLAWHRDHYNHPFHLYNDLLTYCRSDVDVLLNACWKFRELLLGITENAVDPFDYVTIAAVAMGTFRTCFLPEKWRVLLEPHAEPHCNHQSKRCCCPRILAVKKKGCDDVFYDAQTDEKLNGIICKQFHSSPIGLLPPHGYARRDFFSKQCVQWLHIYEKERGVQVQSAMSNLGEKRVYYHVQGKRYYYSLDGYYVDAQGRSHALEFNGCYFHGCPKCYPNLRSETMVGNKSLARRFQDTLAKESMLQKLGFCVESIWSCDFSQQLLFNRQWKKWAQEIQLESPLNLRDCYYGGRTNALVLDKKVDAKLLDFCSLYPAQMKYQRYPCGHPERLAQNIPAPFTVTCYAQSPLMCPVLGRFCPGTHVMLPYFGVMKVKILPPKRLYHPVLPFRCQGKLMFPLCSTCAVRQSETYCNCPDEDRMFTGTWCTPEVETALCVGYTLVHVYEVLHWPEWSDGLFCDFINQFLRLKAQASGWPSAVVTDHQKEDYILSFFKKEGVFLERAAVNQNPGLRTLAKLILNSLYGKFAQRQNMKKCRFVTSSKELYDLLGDNSKNVHDFHILSPNIMLIEYAHAREFESIDPKTNVIISAFCSCYGRLALWRVMYSLDRRVLYHDTDSVIYYSTSPWDWHPPVGDGLGELNDELVCKNVGCEGCTRGHWISEFVSCGPKNYAYRLNTGQTVCKVRGFCLNYTSSQVINFDSMRDTLHAWKNKRSLPELFTVTSQILRCKKEARIYSKKVSKKYSVVYNKRFVKPDMTTRPYGFQRTKRVIKRGRYSPIRSIVYKVDDGDGCTPVSIGISDDCCGTDQ